MFSDRTRGNGHKQGRTSSLWGWQSTGTGCPGRLWSLPLWRYSSPTRTWSCAACCRSPCFGRGVGLDDSQRSLPTPKILWYCDSVRFFPLPILVKPGETPLSLCPVWLKSASKFQTSRVENVVVRYTPTDCDHTDFGFLRQTGCKQMYQKFYLHTTSNFPTSIILQKKNLNLWKKREREKSAQVAKPLNVSDNFARQKQETSDILVVFNK